MEKRYEFTGETKTDPFGRTVRQIRALVAITALAVNVGDLGGWIETESNFPHDGTAWIYPNATAAGPYTTIRGGTIRGGTIWGGTIWGGTIWGGTIWGGTIWGGTIEGGTIRGGTIRGGTIRGGTIEGGTIWGGTIRGGTIWGGTIWGGTIEGGTIRGGTEVKNKEPVFLAGVFAYSVTMTDEHMTVGCQTHTFKEWLAFDEQRIATMAGPDAVTFWKTYKTMLKGICKATGRL